MFSVGIEIIFTFTLVRGRSIMPFGVIGVVVFLFDGWVGGSLFLNLRVFQYIELG